MFAPVSPFPSLKRAIEETYIFYGWVLSGEEESIQQYADSKTKTEVIGGEFDNHEVFNGIDGSEYCLDYLFSDYFPGLKRAAIFLVVWSSIEKHLIQYCKDIKAAIELPISLEDTPGEGVERCLNYIKEVAQIKTPRILEFKKSSKPFNKVRNAFAHATGEINQDMIWQIKPLIESGYITLVDSGIKINRTMLPYFIPKVRNFLIHLETESVRMTTKRPIHR